MDFFGQDAAVPNTILPEQLFEELFNFRGELPRLSGAFAVSQTFDAVLLESVEIIVDTLGAAIEVLGELICIPANGVEADDAGSESDFCVDEWAEFEIA